MIKKSNPFKIKHKLHRAIAQYRLDGKKVNEFESVIDAAIANGTYRSSIRKVATRKLKQLHGFVYRYRGDNYKGEYATLSWEKPVTQYSVEGKKIGHYPSVKEASLKTGIDANTISKCALRKYRLGSGYVWRYQGDTYAGEYKNKIKNKAKPIVQYSLEGKKLARFTSVNQASLETGFSASTLLDCALKRTKVSHGFVWRFEGDSYDGSYKYYHRGKPVTQFTLQGKKIRTYPTIEAAAEATGLTSDNIQKNVKGENKTAGGFVWKNATKKEILSVPAWTSKRSNYVTKLKEIVQYTLDGKKVAFYSSVTDAAKSCKISPSNIYQVLDKPTLTASGFVWRTKGNPYKGELVKQPSLNKARLVTQYDLKGKKIRVFKSTKEVERETGISSSTVSAVANGKLKTTGGFIWQYGNGPKKIDIEAYRIINQEKRPVIKYSLEGQRLKEYASMLEASKVEGISINRITSVVNGKAKSAGGYYWKLKNGASRSIL
jgi:hypothetical protein